MSFFSGTLYGHLTGSTLLKPWSWFALGTDRQCPTVHPFRDSFVFKTIISPILGWFHLEDHQVDPIRAERWQRIRQNVLGAGLAILFLVSMVSDTKEIGALVWILLALHLVFACFPKPKTAFLALNRMDLLILFFFLSIFVATAFSSYTKTSLYGLAKAMTYMAAFWVFRAFFHHAATLTLWRVLMLFALGGFAQSIIGFYQYVNHIQPLATWVDPTTNPELNFTRIFGTLQPSNPNLLAGFLIPSVASGLGVTTWMATQKRWVLVMVWSAITLTVLVALVLTGSRGAYLAIGSMALLSFMGWGHFIWHDSSLQGTRILKKLWISLLFSALVLVGTAIAASEGLRHRLLSIFAMRSDSSISYRLNVYLSSIRMWLDNFWVGIGPGNETFKLVYGMYMVPGYNALGTYSVPLEIAVEQGILGLLAFGWLSLSALIRGLLTLDISQVPLPMKLLSLSLFTAWVGFAAQGVFDTIWYRPTIQISFWALVAMWLTVTSRMMDPTHDGP